MFNMLEFAKRAKAASLQTAILTEDQKNQTLLDMASALRIATAKILQANQLDIKAAKQAKLSDAMIDRLLLTPDRIEDIAKALEHITTLNDPVGKIKNSQTMDNGLKVAKMSIPLGVIAMIYESRPNVTADASALCLKAGNAVILRGGKEAIHSSLAIAAALHSALEKNGIDKGAISVVPDPDRKHMSELLTLTDSVDLIIPRGGEGLIRFVSENSQIPVIQHYKGVCHLYVDKQADQDKAIDILINGKVQRPGVCNSLETFLVHQDIAEEFLPKAAKALGQDNVKVYACERSIQYFENAGPANDEEYDKEYLSLAISLRVVDSFEQAIEHIQKFSSNHTEVIVTENKQRADRFIKNINSAVVMWNASSRFSDGGELGLGAEIGISTSKLHAYGPMGVESLTTEKFVVIGDGQIR
jgi:glutamate-5-semialdehyde dehydrogenase